MMRLRRSQMFRVSDYCEMLLCRQALQFSKMSLILLAAVLLIYLHLLLNIRPYQCKTTQTARKNSITPPNLCFLIEHLDVLMIQFSKPINFLAYHMIYPKAKYWIWIRQKQAEREIFCIPPNPVRP